MFIEDLKQEIGYKERHITDLVRFISTYTEGNPNYSLFLGAGCSVTSDIRSANELIELWRKEICINCSPKEFNNDNYNISNAINYLKEKCTSWYDPRNEYASLFEKRFDLPSQRRAFIEKEVADRKPSLGYAYLVNLVRNGKFNTIFTTNFDDLLNEAFYVFSDQRPITCAHDSAIRSMTITSPRPKIIKLHGDYLFDDLKSTLRETESLENNMKDKFIEFSKDYGLIVIGYGGNDRSIMDILFYLLRTEVYFKNGIYWCLRKNDNINQDLRKLLWKERVYFLEIDGFDEVMGELNYHLNSQSLPIESSIFSNKGNEIIKGILSNQKLKNSSSEIIISDINKLKEQKANDMFKEIINSFETDEIESDPNNKSINKTQLDKKGQRLKISERIELFQLQEKVAKSKYEQVIKEIDNILLNNKDISNKFLVELNKIKAKCYYYRGLSERAIECYIDIEKNDGPSISIYSALMNFHKTYDKKLEYVNKMLEFNNYDYRAYYKKAELLIEKHTDCINKEKAPTKDEILLILNTGIERNPSIDNPSWDIKFDFIFNDTDKCNLEECNKIINSLKQQDPYDLSVLSMEARIKKKNNTDKKDIIDYINDAKEKSSLKNKVDYDFLILNLLVEYNLKDEIKAHLKMIEDRYDVNYNYLNKKARILLQKFDELNEAILILKDSIKNEQTRDTLKRLCKYLLYNDMFDEARDIIFNQLGDDNEDELYKYYECTKNYDAALEITKNRIKRDPFSKEYLVAETFLLLMKNDFKSAHDRCREYLEFSNFTDSVLIINHEIASLKLKHKLNEDRLNRANLDKDNIIKAAVSILKNDKECCYNYIEKELEQNHERKYEFKDWIIFENIKDEKRFKSFYKKT